ncbi:hypothetical protein SAMN05216570_2415 [Dyella sp. OK004]|uniref:hypothetical protein n=1 Tax=Dyella sp. OK004 TaxID=1855292 RepID=UPI0008ED027D|nr:hypothetical protein [Dyella sp. OK004]SFS08504.1 hypothetical protein SAMN05216570_2415 [Dyella sp. OK004]
MTAGDPNTARDVETDGRWKRFTKHPWVRATLRFLKRHREAFYQLFMTVALANIPIAIVYLDKITSLDPKAPHDGYWTILLHLFRSGDVYVYSAALVAPFWWTLLTYMRNKRKMWLAPLPFVLSCFCTVAGGLIYANQLNGRLSNEPVVNTLAIAIFLSSLVVLYWSIYCDQALAGDNMEDPFEKDQDDINDLMNDMDKG